MRNPESQDVARNPQREHRQEDADATDSEEQQRFVVAFAAAAVAETPFPVEDVGRDHGDDAGDHLGGHRLGFQNGQLQGVEDDRVDDERGGADDGELDQFVVARGEGLNLPG